MLHPCAHTLTHVHTHHAHSVICRGCLENQANKPGPRCADPFDSRQRVRSQESARERQHYYVAFKSKPLRNCSFNIACKGGGVRFKAAVEAILTALLWGRSNYEETFNNALVNCCFSEFKTTLTSSRFTFPDTISLFLTVLPFVLWHTLWHQLKRSCHPSFFLSISMKNRNVAVGLTHEDEVFNWHHRHGKHVVHEITALLSFSVQAENNYAKHTHTHTHTYTHHRWVEQAVGQGRVCSTACLRSSVITQVHWCSGNILIYFPQIEHD